MATVASPGQLGSRAHLPVGRWQIPLNDIGIFPFLLLLPFLYVPKVLEGDTQPWVLIGALIALFTYRPRMFIQRKDLPVIFLAVLALVVYVARAGLGAETVRAAYIFLTFAVLWILANRRGHAYFRQGVRYVLAVWFLLGLYQYLALMVGFPVEFSGRFVEGRSGVPSIAAESSYFGSLSVLMTMYLLHDLRRGDAIFIVMAILSVLMSGSLLSVLFLGFPFLYLRTGVKLLAAAGFVALVLVDAGINEAGLSARLAGFQSAEQGLVSLLLDPSLNLRFGHMQFSLWENLVRSLSFGHAIDFQNQYNIFAAETGLLIPTESNFILPIAGELIYGGGMFGLGIIALLIWRGARVGPTVGRRLIRASFIVACLVNPISVANPFLVFYVLQGRPRAKAR